MIFKTRIINYEYGIHLIFEADVSKKKPRVKKNNYSLISFNFLFHFFGYSGILLNLVCGVGRTEQLELEQNLDCG